MSLETLLTSFAVAMLAIVNPVGKVPLFVRACEGQTAAVRHRLATMLVSTAFVILLVSLLFGRSVLEVFGISLPAFRIGGGIVILIIGLQMINGNEMKIDSQQVDGDADAFEQAKARFRDVVVPLAVPILAGPGSISTAILYGSRTDDWAMSGVLALVLLGVMGLVLAVLLASYWLRDLVGDMVLDVQTRLFGLILTGIAAQLLVEGLGEVFPNWLSSDSPISD